MNKYYNSDIYIAVIYNDFCDMEAGFDSMLIGNSKEIYDFVNGKAQAFADECGIPTIPHDYGDKMDGTIEESVYLPIEKGEIYHSHLLCEDSNANRIRVQVRELNCYASIA